MKKIDEKVFQDVFDTLIHHFEWMQAEFDREMSYYDFQPYLIGAAFALSAVLDRECDRDAYTRMRIFFGHKVEEYFGKTDE